MAYREDLAATLWAVTGIAAADAETMVYNLRYACAMARVHYKRVSEPIPTTVEGQARYWKQWYNTPKGRGTVKHYLKEVEGILV